jgi:hypothetical protein
MSSASRIEYSEKYADDANEYRYVPSLVVEFLCAAVGSWDLPTSHTRLLACSLGTSFFPRSLPRRFPSRVS